MKKIRNPILPTLKPKGFTLIEFMVTVTIAGILLGIAVPNMSIFLKNGRLTSVANDLLRSLQLARTEAIKRQRDVAVCATSDGSTCSAGSFVNGWIVFEDSNANGQVDNAEPIVESHTALDSSLYVNTDNQSRVSYSVSGGLDATLVSTSAMTICDSRGVADAGGGNSTARAISISATGRPVVTRSLAAVSGSVACP